MVVAVLIPLIGLLSVYASPQPTHIAREDVLSGKLGTIDFPTSCAQGVRNDLNRAVALLHSFWHNEAFAAFEKVASSDPNCAIAYWGEAMTHFHQLLASPTVADIQEGAAELRKADQATEKGPREAAYVQALHRFFDGYSTDRYLEHAISYTDEMAIVANSYRNDTEAQVFYALALLASQPPDDLQLTNPRKAFAILEPLFREHPNHPGIAHYIIHACDNPQMAADGLNAARRYAEIAPQVPHALHMPAHVFARVGLWQDDIQSNLASKAAAEGVGLHRGAENRLHAMEFLEYAYLQTGRFDQAREIVTEARTVQPSDVNPRYPDMWASVEARSPALLAIETKDWPMAEHLKPVPGGTNQEIILLAHAEGAAYMHNRTLASETLKQLEQLTPAKSQSTHSALEAEIRAWAELALGKLDVSIALLESVAERQAKTGKSEVEIPAREMLADMLLLEGRYSKALTQYQDSLQTDPNRFNGLFGAGQAAAQAGRSDLAAKYYRMLLANCPQPEGGAIEKLHEASAWSSSK